MSVLLIYGANGYTGRQIAAAALARGLQPIVAGRNPAQIAAIGRQLGLPQRSFDLHDPQAVRQGLAGVSVVLHCAGPFSATAQPMLDGCIAAGAHYLDITGEYQVMDAIAARNAELLQAGIMAMSGTGMYVVPSDCLAAHMQRRLPDATSLELYIRALERLSPGTASTFVENMGLPNLVRENGVLVERPAGADRRLVDFQGKRVKLVGLPWGDISSAWHTTGIPDIAVYMSLMPGAAPMMRLGGFFPGMLQRPGVQRFFMAQARRWISGPSAAYQSGQTAEFIAVASNARGQQCRTYLQVKEGYAFTVDSAVEIAMRVLAGKLQPGFRTPGGLFGPDFVLELQGSRRIDLD